MYFKKHVIKDKIVIAVCDEDLVGKKFSEDDYTLDISNRFYKGEKKSEEQIKKILKRSSNINIVGEKIIKLAVGWKIIKKENIIKIGGIPHAQIIEI